MGKDSASETEMEAHPVEVTAPREGWEDKPLNQFFRSTAALPAGAHFNYAKFLWIGLLVRLVKFFGDVC